MSFSRRTPDLANLTGYYYFFVAYAKAFKVFAVTAGADRPGSLGRFVAIRDRTTSKGTIMTCQFFNAASNIPALPNKHATPVHYSTQAARVVADVNAKLMSVYHSRAAEAVRQISLDVRSYALSGASMSAVLETFRNKGYTVSYDAERPHNGGEVLALSW